MCRCVWGWIVAPGVGYVEELIAQRTHCPTVGYPLHMLWCRAPVPGPFLGPQRPLEPRGGGSPGRLPLSGKCTPWRGAHRWRRLQRGPRPGRRRRLPSRPRRRPQGSRGAGGSRLTPVARERRPLGRRPGRRRPGRGRSEDLAAAVGKERRQRRQRLRQRRRQRRWQRRWQWRRQRRVGPRQPPHRTDKEQRLGPGCRAGRGAGRARVGGSRRGVAAGLGGPGGTRPRWQQVWPPLA